MDKELYWKIGENLTADVGSAMKSIANIQDTVDIAELYAKVEALEEGMAFILPRR